MWLSDTTAPWLLSAVIQAAAAILGLGLGSLSVAAVFLYRAGQFDGQAAPSMLNRRKPYGAYLLALGTSSILAVVFGEAGLFMLAGGMSPNLAAVALLSAVALVGSAVFAAAAGHQLWSMIREAAIPKPHAYTAAWMSQTAKEKLERREESSRTARGTDIRPADSAYDRDFATATETLIADLRKAGHEVATPGTGARIVDGIEVPAES